MPYSTPKFDYLFFDTLYNKELVEVNNKPSQHLRSINVCWLVVSHEKTAFLFSITLLNIEAGAQEIFPEAFSLVKYRVKSQ